MARSIVISGFMATGKSTVGPRVAARLGLPFVDTDDELTRAAGKSVADMWRTGGEAGFRAREAELVARLFADDTPRVVAFGGGTVTMRATRHLALERALVVTLTALPATILARAGDLATRPNITAADPHARIDDLLEARGEAYAECHLALSTDAVDPDILADAIVALAARDPIVVPLGRRTYTIDVAHDAPELVTDAIARAAPSHVVVVTDGNVHRARGAAIDRALGPLAMTGTRVTLAAGEVHKTLASVATIWDAALGASVDRDALVVAFGGGVVGDLAGYAASALLRGIRFIQVPTTLLSMVDASIGGKTGFDHPSGKNLLGAFHQPSAVVADLAHLETLSQRERACGLAEVVKIALVADGSLFTALERDAGKLAAGDVASLGPIVRRAILAKARIVRDDEREGGRRALLNLGHTIGHALEAHGALTRYRHGEAVAIGTLVELRVGAAAGTTPPALIERTRALLAELGLPTETSRAEIVAAFPFVTSDKKRRAGFVHMPIVRDAGDARMERLSLEALRAAACVG